MIRKFDNFKLNEHVDMSGVMEITDPEIVELTEFIEDHFEKAKITNHINNDTWERDDYPYKVLSVSVRYLISPSLKEIEVGGNPYSENSRDISSAITDIIENKKSELSFATDVKSLIHRLDKYGYKVNYFSYDKGVYGIAVIIKNRKLKF